ncbi:hypothetical protein ACHAWF_009842, partial [Thalassiosira exigua]
MRATSLSLKVASIFVKVSVSATDLNIFLKFSQEDCCNDDDDNTLAITYFHPAFTMARTSPRRTKKTPSKAATVTRAQKISAGTGRTQFKRRSRMEKLGDANKRLKAARDDHEQYYASHISKLDAKEDRLKKLLDELDKKKLETAQANGNEDAAPDDLVEINAGGKIIAAKRSTLTQLKGTRLEALFSGRWDKEIVRDGHGRIFLDVNSLCFQAIVDYLNEMAISSEDDLPDTPSVDEENEHILRHQLELFGLLNKPEIESKIIKDNGHFIQLHDWLKEDGADGHLHLLYRSSRDDLSAISFHSKCDNKGCTLTIIETNEGYVLGGYSNASWNGAIGNYSCADKAFLFVLDSIEKMKLRHPNNTQAIYNNSSYGPVFGSGNDLCVNGSRLSLNLGNAYQASSNYQCFGGQGYGSRSFNIKEIEVFQVTASAQKASPKTKPSDVVEVSNFSKEVNSAINAKWVTLEEAEEELCYLNDSFKDEGTFVSFFASGKPQDVVTLNVCGSIMVTKRSTLQLCGESVLASKFSDEEQVSSGTSKSIKEWDHKDVVAWLKQLEGISESVVKDFEDNQVTGHELLALGVEGLKDFGVTRKGTIYLLLDRIKKLEKADKESVALIEHSPYCFEKILDHLRLEGSFMKGLVKTKHG